MNKSTGGRVRRERTSVNEGSLFLRSSADSSWGRWSTSIAVAEGVVVVLNSEQPTFLALLDAWIRHVMTCLIRSWRAAAANLSCSIPSHPFAAYFESLNCQEWHPFRKLCRQQSAKSGFCAVRLAQLQLEHGQSETPARVILRLHCVCFS